MGVVVIFPECWHRAMVSDRTRRSQKAFEYQPIFPLLIDGGLGRPQVTASLVSAQAAVENLLKQLEWRHCGAPGLLVRILRYNVATLVAVIQFLFSDLAL
jgi:hypothetical protein